ncbi:ATP-binding protein [Planotetraspora thailandica]|uniref:ATP-binding protein n=1 Tax=Planotetraspora thailandica TaxID=487172 RepID=A0A8J3Y276_9ACTN|nr:AAA family ATPase [Planotetraspora thailandica]GII59380.1 ATP-binding protein [Planotetraspora thailandica]
MAADSVTPTSIDDLRYPSRSLVLLAGMPGAGKSTLLRRLYGLRGDETQPVPDGRGAWVIDSQQSRNLWAPRLAAVPPRLRTPVVHATHVWRVARAVARGQAVVAHTRGTWPHLLHGFAWLARRGGGQMHVILLDVEPHVALAGQRARGRSVSAASFAWHRRRWRVLVRRARAGALPPADGVTVLDRRGADLLDSIRFDEP